MNDIEQFVDAFLEEEYRTLVSYYTERDPGKYEEQRAVLAAFADTEVDLTPYYHRSPNPNEKHFEIGDEKLQKGECARRALFQMKIYEHPERGRFYRVYLGPDEAYGQDPTYAVNLFVAEIAGHLKIVSVYDFNRRYPQRKGHQYFTDNGLAWDHSSGVEINDLGRLLEVQKFKPPRDVSGALAEYNADSDL